MMGRNMLHNRQISIIVSTGRNGQTYSLSVSRQTAWLAAAAFGLMTVGLAVALVLYGRVVLVAGRADSLRKENQLLRQQNERVVSLREEVDRLRTFEAKILAIMGIDTLAAGRDRYQDAWSLAGEPDSLDGGQMSEVFLWPARGAISRGYKFDAGRGTPHWGLDIAGQSGTPVQAALGGRVAFAGVDSIFGNMVVLDHGGGLSTLYGHNSKLIVKEGDRVSGGQVIAMLGSTGRSSAPHLHFEVHEGGNPVDPLKYLQTKRQE